MCGMPCVMVVMKKDFEPFGCLEWKAEYSVEAVIKSSYDDYGRVAEADGYTMKQIEAWVDSREDSKPRGRFHFFIHQRAWDWAVDRYKRQLRPNEMLSDSADLLDIVIQELEKKSKTKKAKGETQKIKAEILKMRRRQELLRPKPWVAEMDTVFVAFMYACRNPLAGYWATGQYHTDTLSELAAHHKLTDDCMIDIVMSHPYMSGDKKHEDNYSEVDFATARTLIADMREKYGRD